jgi:hypothetical protein
MPKVSKIERFCERCSNIFLPKSNRQKYCSECNKGRNANRAINSQFAPTQFIGVDGEGSGDGKDHKYVLLGVGQEQIANPDGLSTQEIFEFLWECFLENPSAAFVGFFLPYDFTHWLKGLPSNRAWYLYTPEGIARRKRKSNRGSFAPFPVMWEGWEFDLLGNKRFRLRREGSSSWLYVCDVGPFFQTSLLSVLDPRKWPEPICSDAEFRTLESGKSARSGAVLDADMRKYNALENEVLSRVMVRLEQGFRSIGVRLRRDQWYGPGQAASAWLKALGTVPRSQGLREFVPRDVLTSYAPWTYYGGWFEITAHGIIPGITHEYDINSAYPYIIAGVPCLEHGRWTIGKLDTVPVGGYTLAHATCIGSSRRSGSMPHRDDDGNIARHQETTGWYWLHEIQASIRAGFTDQVTIHEWVNYAPCTCPPPLRAMADLYEHRIRVGKDTPEGKSSKLVYNAAYGKFAQSLGGREAPWANPVYASLITAGTRCMILDAIASHPSGSDSLVMVATDAVYFREEHTRLALSGQLGQWSHETHDRLTLFKPGVYWSDATRKAIQDGKSPAFKARGISARDFAQRITDIDSHFALWSSEHTPSECDPNGNRESGFPCVEFPSRFSMVSAKQAITRGKWHTAGQLGHSEPVGDCQGCNGAHLVQDADPVIKRHTGEWADGVYWSRPHRGWPETDSSPYSKEFGQIFDPEESGIGLTEDGWTTDNIAAIFSE